MKNIEKALDKLHVYIDICEEELVIDTTKNNRKLLANAKAELAQLKENLRGIEFCCDNPDYGYSWCPVCGGLDKDYPGCPPKGHTPDCWLKAIIGGVT